MKILATGHNGYIGVVLTPILQDAGHEVVGLDTNLFDGCGLELDDASSRFEPASIQKDVRDVEVEDLAGYDAVIHLAALSNDPLGNLDENLTYEINHLASTRLARLAKEAAVRRFLFSSSCSLYGASDNDFLTEEASFNPVTAYGWSKIKVEEDLRQLADSGFSPTYLRNSTAYGLSRRLRGDLVVNNLTGVAFLTGEALLQSDGMAWRPLVHIEDISRAFLAVLEAPLEVVHDQAFNVGATSENYLIRDVAEAVRELVLGTKVTYSDNASADARNYRVNCDKIAAALPAFQPQWTVRRGVEQLYSAFQSRGLTEEEFLGPSCQRLMQVRLLLDDAVRVRSSDQVLLA